MSKLPTLTGNDLALATFGVIHMIRWWESQSSSGVKRDEIRKSKALSSKLQAILAATAPPKEDDGSIPDEGWIEDLYAPTPEAIERAETKA